MPSNTVTLRVSPREFHTIIAALRYFQEHGQCEPINRSAWIEDLASNLGQATALTALEIDQLCERLNTSDSKENGL